QWEKLNVFNTYFKKWDKVIFFDAGLRIFDSIDYFLKVDCKNSIVALDDAYPNGTMRFECQLEKSNIKVLNELTYLIQDILEMKYFLNCFFIFDTSIIEDNTVQDMILYMNAFPIMKTNEMGIMNIYFT